ncbi:MAG: hypothetical protein CSA86_03060 [Arcobacter sp.]|nr:MAG: hypothetical protein CSA86_03060 [Arcobacter sp.]
MASDLSKLIQDSITLTLNSLLAKEAKIVEITKTHIKDVENLQILKIQSVFNFSNFSSEFSFFIPAISASLIFNTMMGSPLTELSDVIDDDTEDAIGEFISNTSGTLTTAINNSALDDLGGHTKFNISHKEILAENTPLNLENTYKFKIDLEGNELILFIEFDEALHPYIPQILASEITYYEETKEIVEEEKIAKEVNNEEEKEEKEEGEASQLESKTKKLKLAIIAIASFIVLILISFFIMIMMGVFDSDSPSIEKENVNIATTKKNTEIKTEKIDVIENKTLKKINFKISDINVKRLNTRLEGLTKYSILNKKELEEQKIAEKNRLLELEREKKLLEFAKKNHEEPLYKTTKIEKEKSIAKKTDFKKETLATSNNDKKKNNPKEKTTEELHYIVTNSFKYSLFKKLVQQTPTQQARISICNNKEGETALYIGPFETKELQTKMMQLISISDSSINKKAIEMTEETFNTKCNLE